MQENSSPFAVNTPDRPSIVGGAYTTVSAHRSRDWQVGGASDREEVVMKSAVTRSIVSMTNCDELRRIVARQILACCM